MDTKQIIILLIIGGIYIFNTFRKLKAKAEQNNTPANVPTNEDDFEDDYNPKSIETLESRYSGQMAEIFPNYAESIESDSLEQESLESIIPDFNTERPFSFDSQISDNEIDNILVISTETDDLRKGFIYSEILQRKYN